MSKNKAIPLIILAIFFISVSDSICDESSLLEGCDNPGSAVDPLRKISNFDWLMLDQKEVQKIWPVFLYGNSKISGPESYVSLNSRGRVIKGVCECCANFEFDLSGQDQKLRSVVIFHSSTSRDILLKDVETFLQAMEIPKDSMKTISDSGDDRLYSWEKAGIRHAVHIDIYKSKNLWTVRLGYRKTLSYELE